MLLFVDESAPIDAVGFHGELLGHSPALQPLFGRYLLPGSLNGYMVSHAFHLENNLLHLFLFSSIGFSMDISVARRLYI